MITTDSPSYNFVVSFISLSKWIKNILPFKNYFNSVWNHKNNRKNLFEEYKKKDKLEVRKIEEIINEKKRKNTEFKDMQKNNQNVLHFFNFCIKYHLK